MENKEKIPAFAVLIVLEILNRAIRKGKEGADAWVETKEPNCLCSQRTNYLQRKSQRIHKSYGTEFNKIVGYTPNAQKFIVSVHTRNEQLKTANKSIICNHTKDPGISYYS